MKKKFKNLDYNSRRSELTQSVWTGKTVIEIDNEKGTVTIIEWERGWKNSITIKCKIEEVIKGNRDDFFREHL